MGKTHMAGFQVISVMEKRKVGKRVENKERKD